MKVREDVSGVTENDTDEVCFEFNGPIYRMTNVHYTIPVHYTTQMSYQMAMKHC